VGNFAGKRKTLSGKAFCLLCRQADNDAVFYEDLS
jgi:hypothetical protein